MHMFTCALLVVVATTTEVWSVRPLGFSQRLLHINGPTPRQAPVTCADRFGPVCGDCNTLLTCVGSDPPAARQNCGSIYPGQPYCVDNACSSDPDPNDNSCTAGIKCTSEGYFPNPSNCSQYYLCNGPLGQSQLYECISGFVYNPVDKSCKRRVSTNDCYTINCTNASNQNRYVVYPGDRAYYAFCLENNGIVDAIMFRCDDPDNFQFNQVTRRCAFQCQAEGRVADKTNCRQYYECFRVGTAYVSRLQTCIDGYIYDGILRQCVRGSCQVDPPTINPGNGTGNGGANGDDNEFTTSALPDFTTTPEPVMQAEK